MSEDARRIIQMLKEAGHGEMIQAREGMREPIDAIPWPEFRAKYGDGHLVGIAERLCQENPDDA